jgi:hypothetical membrane protein
VGGNRLRWGALGWVLTLQFFVVETIAQFRQSQYSRVDDVISDLGAGTSPARSLMNASFVVQGALILAGVLLLLPAVRGTAARVAQVLLAASAVGVVLVGVFPEDGAASGVHTTGAVLHLAAGTIGLVALAYAVRPRSELAGSLLAVLGVVGVAASIFFLDAVTEYLGRGGTERLAAYPIPVGLAVAAVVLWRMADRDGVLPEVGAAEDRPTRRQLREQARAERAEQARLRDLALEEAAARRAGSTGPTATTPAAGSTPAVPTAGPSADPSADEEPEDDDFDPDDPWAPRRRRRD